MLAYPHIAERLFGRPHAIEPMALRVIMDGPVARRVLQGEKIEGKPAKKGRDLRRERLAAVAGAESVRSADGLIDYALTADGVAIVPVAGVLSRRFDWLAAACGWSTYEGLAATLESAIADFRVRAVLLDVDSPGGEAAGMLDLSDAILAAREEKPVWAVANTLAASAAYAIAGSADRLALPRLAQVGSIGCMTVHVDVSARDAAFGESYTAIYSGARKIDGWGHAALSAGALAAAQADVDHVRAAFAALVGRQGRLSAQDALKTEAALYADDAAVAAGLADDVMTFDEALAALTQEVQTGAAPMPKTRTALRTATSTAALRAASPQDQADLDRQAAEGPIAGAAGVAVLGAEAPAAAITITLPKAAAKDEMVAPKPGEQCMLCGQSMPYPDDGNDAGDQDGDDKEQETRGHAHPPAAAAASAYSVDDAAKTLELCAIARVPVKVAQGFVAAKTPLAKVRAELARRAAEAADGVQLDTTAPASSSEAQVAAAWNDVVGKLNASIPGLKRPPR